MEQTINIIKKGIESKFSTGQYHLSAYLERKDRKAVFAHCVTSGGEVIIQPFVMGSQDNRISIKDLSESSINFLLNQLG